MSAELRPAWLTPPYASGLAPREPLLARLANASPLVWLHAPAGSGKTALVSDWFRCSGRRGIWYEAEAGGRDPAGLFRVLSTALGDASALPGFSAERQADLKGFSRIFFRELYARLPHDCVLVLDNCETIQEEPAFSAILCAAVQERHPKARIMVTSRLAPPGELARLRLQGLMQVIEADELALQRNEAHAIARLHAPDGELDDAVIDELWQRSRGWLAGFLLLLQQRIQHPRAAAGDDTSPLLGEYLHHEVLTSIGPTGLEQLLDVATLPWTTAEMATELTGDEASARLLGELAQRHMFVSRHEGGPVSRVYEIHPLLRDYLLARAKEVLPPQRLTALRAKAGRLLVEVGDRDSGMRLLMDAQAWEEVVPVMLDLAPQLAMSGRFRTLHTWLEALPQALFTDQPWLGYWQAVCLLPVSPMAAREQLSRCQAAFTDAGEVAGALSAWISLMESVWLAWDDCHVLDPWLDTMPLSPADPQWQVLPGELTDRAATYALLGLLLRRPGDPAVKAWSGRLYDELSAGAGPDRQLRLAYPLMIEALWFSGDRAAARRLSDRFLVPARDEHAEPLMRLMRKAAEAGLHFWQDDSADGCIRCVEDGLRLARESGIPAQDLQLTSLAVYAALACGQVDTARTWLDRMAQSVHMSRVLDVSLHHFLLGWEAHARGDTQTALAHALEAERLAVQGGWIHSIVTTRMGVAQAAFAAGDRRLAARMLISANRLAKQTASPLYLTQVRLTAARHALEGGHRRRGLSLLARGMAEAARLNLRKLLCWTPAETARLCREALLASIEPAYVHDLVMARGLELADPPVEIRDWPWDLSIDALGGLRVCRGGEPLESLAARSREMLMAVVAEGGEIAHEKLMDLLWPDAEGDAARRSFDTTLHRLRGQLGCAHALLLRNGRLGLNQERCWLDTAAFRRRLELAATGDERERLDHRLAAHALYRGPLLDGETAPGLAAARRRLERAYVDAVVHAAAMLGRVGRDDEAERICEEAIERAPGAEILYRWLFDRYTAQGRGHEAAGIYERCREVLEAEGSQPSESFRVLDARRHR
jgi:LuxR family transcriptional regulator, maltose regulon positive regulatory protein